MDVVSAFWAGIVGTVGITILMYAGPMMGMPRMDIIGMLGTMFTGNRSVALAIGTVMHLAMGVVFAIVYAWLWSLGVGAPVWTSGLLFGVVHAIAVGLVMPIMLRVHPRSPDMEMSPKMIAGSVMGHAVFGVIVALMYTG